jgi:hypothetical protein
MFLTFPVKWNHPRIAKLCGIDSCRGAWKMNRFLMVFAAFLTLAACASQPQQGQVSLLVVEPGHHCQVITTVYGEGAWGDSADRAHERAVRQVKNRAARAGANAIAFEDTYSKVWGSMILAEALHCDEQQFDQLSLL